MMALVEFFILFLVWPYVLFGIILAKIWEAVCTVFQPALLMASVWIASMGLLLLPSSFPTDRPYVTMVELVAQGHIFGIQTPNAIFCVAAIVLVLSVFARQRRA
uniref:Transmembrane protein n=1 Tax=Pseudomonas fluorescens (strain SBW25) TaxID=216595 RepID=A0A0G4E4H6_PSEFS|nr:hypothetical protein [Pseudomonas fluorescens]CEK42136.1 hypothetical protein PQBR57_0183 [Pseudomonas fluorescens SBW25]